MHLKHNSEYQEDLADLGKLQELDKKDAFSAQFQGIVVKLSILERYNIGIEKILKQSNLEIIIDAEYQRLDHWLEGKLFDGLIKTNDLARLTLTIQIKRSDAMMQYINLKKYIDLGLTLVIVGGHASYLEGKELYGGSITKRFAKFIPIPR